MPWLTRMSPRTFAAAGAPGAARTLKGPIVMLRVAAPASAGYHRANETRASAAAPGTFIERHPTSAAKAELPAATPNVATAVVAMKLRMIITVFESIVSGEIASRHGLRLNALCLLHQVHGPCSKVAAEEAVDGGQDHNK